MEENQKIIKPTKKVKKTDKEVSDIMQALVNPHMVNILDGALYLINEDIDKFLKMKYHAVLKKEYDSIFNRFMKFPNVADKKVYTENELTTIFYILILIDKGLLSFYSDDRLTPIHQEDKYIMSRGHWRNEFKEFLTIYHNYENVKIDLEILIKISAEE